MMAWAAADVASALASLLRLLLIGSFLLLAAPFCVLLGVQADFGVTRPTIYRHIDNLPTPVPSAS